MQSYFVFFLIYSWICSVSSSSGWSWKCIKDEEGERCIREKTFENKNAVSLQTCTLICGEAAALFPTPHDVKLGRELVYFFPSQIHHSPTTCQDKICSLLSEAFEIMIESLHKYHPKFEKQSVDELWVASGRHFGSHTVTVDLRVKGLDEYMTLDTKESYKMEISTKNLETMVVITAPTFFGARHALETLSQLIDYNHDRNSLMMVNWAIIDDFPTFPYRGILIDTSRNYFPVNTLKRVIDGMAYNKLNTFHWHISDSQSFPLSLKSLPKMNGAYSPEEVYTGEDVKELVQYARVRGVRIVPELDAPAHVGYGWEWGPEEGLGDLVVCLNKQPWKLYCAGPPCGQMNLANENLYHVLGKVYEEMVDIFHPVEMFHFGGDEVNLKCWNDSSEIQDWMNLNNFGLEEDSYMKQWSVFQERVRNLVIAANQGKMVPGILWTSTLTEGSRMDDYLDKDKYIIQIWSKGGDPVIKDILEKGFKVIFSNSDKLYLDCGVASWVADGSNWCSPYKGWQEIYDNDIRSIALNQTGSKKHENQILGAEVAAWSEQIDENTIEAKLWPRGAAHAERLWTNPTGNYSTAENRLLQHRHRLVLRGLKAARLQPEWCRQNARECRLPWKPKTVERIMESEAIHFLTTKSSSSSIKSRNTEDMKTNLFFVLIFNIVSFLCFC